MKCIYEKYRPKNLKSFYGQKIALKTIKYFKKKKVFPLNILLYGRRGTGKTSFSKIIFKYINCKKNICEKCKNCKNEIDFIEIDASSNRKVEEISKIFKKINICPIYNNFRMFCIDEAQMLSKYSFGYLLKKMENLLKSTCVILITTEVKKIPKTIKSRCFLIKLNKYSTLEIYSYLKIICKKEKIKIDKKAIYKIAENSKNNLRDSLITLEHSLSISKKKIKSKNVEKVLNIPKQKLIFSFSYFMLRKKEKEIIKIIMLLEYYKISFKKFLVCIFKFLCRMILIKKKVNLFFLLGLKKYSKFFLKYKIKDIIKILYIIKKEIKYISFFNNIDYMFYIIETYLRSESNR